MARVVDGVARLHRSSDGYAVVERRVTEPIAQVIHNSDKVDDRVDDSVIGARAIQGGGRLRLVEALEEDGEVRERGDDVGVIPGTVK